MKTKSYAIRHVESGKYVELDEAVGEHALVGFAQATILRDAEDVIEDIVEDMAGQFGPCESVLVHVAIAAPENPKGIKPRKDWTEAEKEALLAVYETILLQIIKADALPGNMPYVDPDEIVQKAGSIVLP